MKKVLITAHEDYFIKHFLVPYLKMYKDQGYEVHVATNGNSKFEYCDKKIVIPFKRNPYDKTNYRAYKELKKIIDLENYSVINTHTPIAGVATRLAARKVRKKGTKVIYTAHGFHFFKGSPIFSWLFYYPVEKFLANITDKLVVINKEDYEIAKRKFNTKVYLIPGIGLNTTKFDKKITTIEKNVLRKSLGIKKNDFVMTYVAELSKRKNQEWLIKTIAPYLVKNQDVKLLLVGNDSLNYKLQSMVNDLKLSNKIKFLGYREDISELLQISNVSVSTSTQEGLPLNVLESMYIGLPIILTNCRGNRDLIKHKYNGYLVNQNDKKTFIKYIIKIKKNINKEDFKKNNLKDINKYLIENVLDLLKEIY